MSIQRFFNRSFVTRRLEDLSNGKEAFVSTGTFEGHLQKQEGETDSGVYAIYGATHFLWCDISENIKEGDQIIDEKGNKYSVVACIDEGENIAENEHKKLLLKKYSDEK